MPRAGKYRDQITIQKNTPTKGSSGGVQPGWAAIADGTDVWAGRLELSGNDAQASNRGGGNVSPAFVQWELRYVAGVTAADCRIVHGGLYYNVTHVNNVAGRNKTLIVTTQVGANHG